MSNMTREQVIEWLSNQSILEISNLIKDLETKWGISSNMQLNSNPSNNVVENENKSKEKTEFNLFLSSFGTSKINVIKEVRAITGLGLKESKDLVESAPKIIKENLKKEEAESLKKRLESVGATIELK